MEQRLPAIEADAANPKRLRIIQQVKDDRQRELMAGMELAAVAAAIAPEVRVGGQGREDLARIRADDAWPHRGDGVSRAVDAFVGTVRHVAQDWKTIAEGFGRGSERSEEFHSQPSVK